MKVLVERYNEGVNAYNAFDAAVKNAYANQSPPQKMMEGGIEYHIQASDFKICETLRENYMMLYEKTTKIFEYYYYHCGLSTTKQNELLESNRQYAEDLINKKNQSYNELYNDLYGLGCAYHYPTPKERRHNEWVHEHSDDMRIMFGF